jgi:hypothetical protein
VERRQGLAEHALDSVLCRRGRKEIRDHEAEIEAKTDTGAAAIMPITYLFSVR